VVLPADHGLARKEAVSFGDLRDQAYIAVSRRGAPALRSAVDAWCQQQGLTLTPSHSADSIASGIALILTQLIRDGTAPRPVVLDARTLVFLLYQKGREARIFQAQDLREFGFTNPVLIDEEDGIIAGHGRVLAAHLLAPPIRSKVGGWFVGPEGQ
jgi:hypothetical protein